MTYRHISVTPVAGALGAEITGVDLREPLNGETVAEIRQAFLEHLVVFLRNQPISPMQQLRFARYFGTPEIYPMIQGLSGHPEITPVVKLEHETVNFGGLWHSDTAYLERPPMATMLLAQQTPPVGGDTLWANQYLAYETLSAGLQRALAHLCAVNSSANADVYRPGADHGHSYPNGGAARTFEAIHPVVRHHPETARPALYVNVAHTVRFEGWTEPESRSLLDYLFRHQVRPEFTFRLRWAPGTIALWDNRCTQHNPINDYHGYRRLMHRIILAGEAPR